MAGELSTRSTEMTAWSIQQPFKILVSGILTNDASTGCVPYFPISNMPAMKRSPIHKCIAERGYRAHAERREALLVPSDGTWLNGGRKPVSLRITILIRNAADRINRTLAWITRFITV